MKKRTSKAETKQGCSGCIYFKDYNAENQRANTQAGMGECRRYPPSMGEDDDGDSYFYWPGTAADEWCGEFKQRCNA